MDAPRLYLHVHLTLCFLDSGGSTSDSGLASNVSPCRFAKGQELIRSLLPSRICASTSFPFKANSSLCRALSIQSLAFPYNYLSIPVAMIPA